MTRWKALAINLLMLAVAMGVIYWATEQETNTEPAQPAPVVSQPATPADPERAPLAVPENPAPEEPPPAASAPARGSATPESDKTPPARPAPPARRPVTFPLDLNSARVEDLMQLPGIGETLAQRLVDYRNRHGRFRSVDDLRRVRGIGEKRMEQLRPLVMTAEAP